VAGAGMKGGGKVGAVGVVITGVGVGFGVRVGIDFDEFASCDVNLWCCVHFLLSILRWRKPHHHVNVNPFREVQNNIYHWFEFQNDCIAVVDMLNLSHFNPVFVMQCLVREISITIKMAKKLVL
jgi:hypothetical protein